MKTMLNKGLAFPLSVFVTTAAMAQTAPPNSYELVPLASENSARNSFAASIDNSGLMLTALQEEFNPPIDVVRLEQAGFFDNPNFPLTAPEDVRNGIFNDVDYSTIVNFLLSSRGNTFVQQLANFRAFSTDINNIVLVPGLDEITDTFNDYTHSVVTLPYDSLDGDYVVGTSEGVFRYITYTNNAGNTSTFTVSDILQRGFVQFSGITIPLLPTDTTLGGISQARGINQQRQVAGFGTVSFRDTLQTAIDNCTNEETRPDQPVEVCLRNIRINQTAFEFSSQIRPIIWQLDNNGTVVNQTVYPLVFTPEADDTIHYNGHAYAINDQGVAVGQSQTGEVVIVTRPGSFAQREAGSVATVYENGETREILERSANLQSIALDINNNGIVVGDALKSTTQSARQQMFIHRLENNETLYRYGFFNGSAVNVRAINNNNIVVGRADVEGSTDALREVHAFMYLLEQDEFVNLNDMVACDSGYVLVDAVDINDNNEIIANARITRPRKHPTGNNLLDVNGNTIPQDNIVTVKLVPSVEAPTGDCSITNEPPFERQGASMSGWVLLIVSSSLYFRRRKNR